MAFSSVHSSWEAALFPRAHRGEEGTDCGASVPPKSRPPLPVTGAGIITELKHLMRPEGLGP